MSTNRISAKSDSGVSSKLRATAVRHARGIEDKKRLQAQIADLIVEAFDLPTNPSSTPENASPQDTTLFKRCLGLFQPSDLDDLVRERNIDDRCGYALCSRPNQKIARGGEMVWNRKSGRDFKLVNKAELEKWCSADCSDRGEFVYRQLSSEPAWLRAEQSMDVKLLEEIMTFKQDNDSLDKMLKDLSLESSDGTGVARESQHVSKIPAATLKLDDQAVDVVEHTDTGLPSAPSLDENNGSVEGHKPKQVRFAEDRNFS